MFRIFERIDAWTEPEYFYVACEVSVEERLKGFREGIRALKALLRYVDALIDREMAR
jgi:hypothetical protein